MPAIAKKPRRGTGPVISTRASSSRSGETSAVPVTDPRSKRRLGIQLPSNRNDVELEVEGKSVKLTNLGKLFWPDLGITKCHLIQYYADVSPYVLPHLEHRAMVMKRYPNGAYADFFFQKRAPVPRPDWIDICSIEHSSGNVIDFPIIRDLPSLLWVVNLGCIDLNPWYARCDDVDRPDYLHFDLDPVKGADFNDVLKTALLVQDALEALGLPNYPKTTGSRGIHVYVPIERDPLQKEVWTFAKRFAQSMEKLYPDIVTAEYKVARRPAGHVLVDYNQNAWGRTLSSVYSVRPKPHAPVSTPVTWKEIREGIHIEDFRLDNVRERLDRLGDLWAPVAANRGRADLKRLL